MNLVVSGEQPSLIASGIRKSVITPSPASASQSALASARHTDTCAPRRPGSRGLPSVKPSGASRSSNSSIAYSVSARALAVIAGIPASAESRAPSSTAARPSTFGVPESQPDMPSARS